MIKSPILCTPEKSEVRFCFISFFKREMVFLSANSILQRTLPFPFCLV